MIIELGLTIIFGCLVLIVSEMWHLKIKVDISNRLNSMLILLSSHYHLPIANFKTDKAYSYF